MEREMARNPMKTEDAQGGEKILSTSGRTEEYLQHLYTFPVCSSKAVQAEDFMVHAEPWHVE